jgi:hypothetical protein
LAPATVTWKQVATEALSGSGTIPAAVGLIGLLIVAVIAVEAAREALWE